MNGTGVVDCNQAGVHKAGRSGRLCRMRASEPSRTIALAVSISGAR